MTRSGVEKSRLDGNFKDEPLCSQVWVVGTGWLAGCLYRCNVEFMTSRLEDREQAKTQTQTILD